MSTTYAVTARRWARGWELHIADVGVTQSPTLAGAEKMVREYIALAFDLDTEDGFDVRITPEVDAEIARELADARQAAKDAEAAQRAAATRWREVARRLHRGGMSGNDIARVLDVSKQRVSQLIN